MSKTKKRFWVVAISKPCPNGKMTSECITIHTTCAVHEIFIEDTVQALVRGVPGWVCGQMVQVKGFVNDVSMEITNEMVERHKAKLVLQNA